MFDSLEHLLLVLLYGDGDKTGDALYRAMFGNLLAPRGVGSLALLAALLCSVAAIRANRIYDRTVNINNVGHHDIYDDTSQLAYQLEAKLLGDVRAKTATMFIWLCFACTLFAIQAHMLSLDAPVWSAESPLFKTAIDYKWSSAERTEAIYFVAIRNLFGLLAMVAFATWIGLTLWSESNDGPAKRLGAWWHGLVDPTTQPTPREDTPMQS